jgi:plasmid stabilization system protein ParE
MPRGSKDKYTDKQKRKAEHIEEGYEERGVSPDEAERRAWATVNKQDGGGRAGAGAKSTGRKRAAASSKTTARGKAPARRRASGSKTTAKRAKTAGRARKSGSSR